ncbi:MULTISPECIES: universal stress protein [Desulfotignum]|jgi:nucleotide-binding universal stress UspA family protein|uniref:UspA domain-containing protein n=1 Tax=Desulfotignum phosphitoxidans DSM 13687 TaxID=1286635 RepID=S0FZK2_9BACT|nr:MULTISPECIES: universal stress protein [Desulfotignum]EMS80563.1 UspA domain-containing protein [Desulfotignum phosphitoxidans DSM 13687]
MEKQVLVPVDQSRTSLQAVRYAARVSSFIKDLHCVLYHVQAPVSLYLKEEAARDMHVRAQMNRVLKKNEAAAMELLNRLKSEMTDAGFPKDRIRLLTRPRELGLAQDVIEYAQKKMMDAIVVGRRGVSGIHKFFDTSVSEAILERSQVIPVWMVNKDAGQNSTEKILVAIDGSEDALRAVDHVGFMISENKEVHVTLIHVTNTAHNYCEINLEDDPEFVQIIEKKDRACVDQFYPQAMDKFKQMGLSQNQVDVHTLQGSRRIGQDVVTYAEKNKFNTLVIGRRGINKSFFMGSVSRQIISHASDIAVWIVP